MLGLLILDFPSHRMLNKTEHEVATRGVKCGQMGLDSLHPQLEPRLVDEVQRYRNVYRAKESLQDPCEV